MSLNALSVDLEESYQVSDSAGVIERDKRIRFPSCVGVPTHRLLDTFTKTSSRATFIVRGWVAERHPGSVRETSDRGHEITCHGYRHELVYEIGRERFRDT
jgi:peptidoglycan/xylan/chitin deacetylase (PgdA/CDA1 family)